VLRDSGDSSRIDQMLADFDADPALAEANPWAHGYLTLIRGYFERDRGHLVAALELIGAALRDFERATEERARWQASALLQAADIYGQFGMTDQAYRLLTQSLGLYAPASAPARTAAALMKLAMLDRSTGRIEAAASWYRRAARIYDLLGLPVERSEAELGLLETRLPETSAAALAELDKNHDWSHLSAANDGRRAMVEVRWLIIAGRLKEAEVKLTQSAPDLKAFAQRMLAARLRAELEHRQKHTEKALQGLEKQLSQFSRLSNRSATGALNYLAARSARELREDWLRLALSDDPRPTMDRWWQALVQSAPLQSVAPGKQPGTNDDRLSTALSKELLGTGPTSDSDRALLLALAERPEETSLSNSKMPTLPQVREELGDGWLMVVVPGEPHSVALWISADQSRIATLPGRNVLREQVRRLTADLNAPTTAVSQIGASARALSTSLFTDAPSAAAPGRLLLLSDELIGTVPLSLLQWPGSEQPLIDTTVTGWIAKFAIEEQADAATAGSELRAIIAPGNAATERAGLSRLRYAEHEAELIAEADPQRKVRSASGSAATRAALLDALTEPAAWVHLAAHGYAKPELLGYAGAWLASPTDASHSEFLSWLDVIDTPLRAPLAVLNACQLAAGPGATSQSSLSFASAVAAAGVNNVVAAFWPISDSASAVWIPAFYQAMREQPPSRSIEALRTAQLALKNSRAYRHPYYWASLAHFQRFTVPAKIAAQQPATAGSGH
jgi:CHAT domain-containing protein/tetratricopeptide (TPR) repeat protein